MELGNNNSYDIFVGTPKSVLEMIGFPTNFECNAEKTVDAHNVQGLSFYKQGTDLRIDIVFKLPTDQEMEDALYYPQPVYAEVNHEEVDEKGYQRKSTVYLTPHTFINIEDDPREFEPYPNDITCTNKDFGDMREIPIPPEELTFTTEGVMAVYDCNTKEYKHLVIPKKVQYRTIHNTRFK